MKLSPRDAAAQHFKKHPFCPPGATLIVAVSGGPDSMALLDALVRGVKDRGHSIIVAHLHHGLRGAEADQDQAFVEEAARVRNLEFRTARVNVSEIADADKRSLEDAARRVRRAFLEDVRKKRGGAAIALGHTRNDQAETLLMNLLRGAGPKGLAAMAEYGPGCLTRPLLPVSREDVVAYLESNGILFRHDATNLDTAMTRNRIRHELLPLLREQFNPNIVDTLARQTELFGEIDTWLAREAARCLTELSRSSGGGARSFETGDLAELPPPLLRKLLRAAIRDITGSLDHVGHVHIDALVQMVHRSGSALADLPGVIGDREGSRLRLRGAGTLSPPDDPPDFDPLTIAIVPGSEVSWGSACLRVSLIEAGASIEALWPPDGRRSAWFDADQLGGTMVVRALRPGDRIQPYGMTGRRKVSDVFTDLKMPRRRREHFRALVQGSEGPGGGPEDILWIPGIMRSDHAVITPETRKILILDFFGEQ